MLRTRNKQNNEDLSINGDISRGRLAQWKNTRFVNFRSQGDHGWNPAEDFSFQTQFILHKCLTELPTIGRVTSVTQPYRSKKLLRQSLLGEEERSLENWSYEVTS